MFESSTATQNEQSIPRRRRRGEHSVECLNPKPKHVRKTSYKKLPGPMGRLARIAAKKKIHASLVLLQAFPAMGRQRDFQDVRKELIDALYRAILDCLDMATLMPTKCWEQIAAELDVTPSRLSRVLKEVYVPAGMIYPFDTKDFEPQYNSTHGVFFPSLMVVTDKFFEAGGASEELIQKLRDLSAEKLQLYVDANTGRPMGLNAAQALRKRWAWDRAYERRKDAARAQKKRAYLASLGSVDERLKHVGKQLMLQDPRRYLSADYKLLQIDSWAVLHRLNVATVPKNQAVAPPH